jgi:hypothetical protein
MVYILDDSFKFIYHKEFWFLSTFINSLEADGQKKAIELETFLLDKIKQLNDDAFKNTLESVGKLSDANKKREILLEMVKCIDIKCKWNPFIRNFLYRDENKNLVYDILGYFQFEVEYFKNDSKKKEYILADLIQQIPIKVKELLETFITTTENKFLYLDIESPIYVFVISKEIRPQELIWTPDQINKHKETLGKWIEIYSEQWPDYSEEIFNKRIENNLSYRLSELHFIHQNSGFIYMSQENYNNFFEPYMIKNVLFPTAMVRAVQFALMTVNKAIEYFFKYQRFYRSMGLDILETQVEDLRNLRGTFHAELTQTIYNELYLNKQQYYTTVLTHLIHVFNLETITNRLDKKFKLVQELMENLYNKKILQNITTMTNMMKKK